MLCHFMEGLRDVFQLIIKSLLVVRMCLQNLLISSDLVKHSLGRFLHVWKAYLYSSILIFQAS
jgi:hypothetical protein